ncbi:hypothetical protein [Paenibacillus sp. Y412MC10]|uniref:hypothetical protein n=1 Tax=Geobacillus sp. (strain Y412MC10) TaxID=481743 RepID=UPI0011AA64C5|nr:hypothetical protein [Paenibacillus sp. Y412MC10]
MGWMIGITAGTVLVLWVLIGFGRKRSSGRKGNVIQLKSKTRSSSGQRGQACSKCRRKRPLTFYADDSGAVRGLCTDCKKELGRHQELYPV